MQWKIHIVDPMYKRLNRGRKPRRMRGRISHIINMKNQDETYISNKDMESLYRSFASSIQSVSFDIYDEV